MTKTGCRRRTRRPASARAVAAACVAAVSQALALASWADDLPSAAPALNGAAADRFVRHLVETADQACFERGGDAEQLKTWALAQSWTSLPRQELERNANEFATQIGGWTHTNEFGAFAVIQSQIKPPGSGYVCSLTTKLASQDQHAATKAAFAQRYGAAIAEELDKPEQHTDRYWIERGERPPVRATIVHVPSSGAITIRMIHGRAMPLRS